MQLKSLAGELGGFGCRGIGLGLDVLLQDRCWMHRCVFSWRAPNKPRLAKRKKIDGASGDRDQEDKAFYVVL